MKTTLVLCFLFFFAAFSVSADDISVKLIHKNTDEEIFLDVSVADNRAEREQGLRFTLELSNDGMMFSFDNEGIHRIWAKDTFLPLTMFWFTQDGQMVGKTRLTPFDLTIHSSPDGVKYGLEMESVMADELNIGLGFSLTFQE